MAYCDALNSGLSPFCGYNLGGVAEAYIADYDKVDTVTIGTASTVTAISMTQSGVFYKFEFREDTSSFAVTNTPTTSSDLVEQVGTLVFQQLSTSKNTVFSLLRGKKLMVIYKDSNGQYWLSGYSSATRSLGVRLTNLEMTTGADRSDDNVYTLTLTARETELPWEVSADVIATITS